MSNVYYKNYELDGIEYIAPAKKKRGIKKQRYEVSEQLIKDLSSLNKSEQNIIRKYKLFSWNINKSIRVREDGETELSNKSTDILFSVCSKIKRRFFEKTLKREKELELILDKASMYDNIVVNRRIKGKEFEFVKEKYREFENNNDEKFFSKKDFCSTYAVPCLNSKSVQKKVGFLVILVPKGYNALYLDNLKRTLFTFEKEILIQKSSKFEFVKDCVFMDNNVFVVKLIN